MRKATIVKTISIKIQLVKEIEELSEKENRTFSNMAETLMLLGLEKLEPHFS